MRNNKNILVIMVLLCFILVFCLYGCKADENDENSNKIELTTENVDTYLKCTVQTYSSDYDWKTATPAHIKSILTIKGVSSNYDYKDIYIIVKLEGYLIISGGSRKAFTQEFSCRLDISGNGSDSETSFADNFTGKRGTRLDGVTGTRYTITYVSGYVEKV